MNKTAYPKKRLADVYISRLGDPKVVAQASGSIADWIEVSPTGNDFIDLFATLVRRYGHMHVKHYAAMMGIKPQHLLSAVAAMTGMGASEWICEYARMASCELLEKTDLSITEISRVTGFPSVSTFGQFFRREEKCNPYEWRALKKGGRKSTYHG